MVRAVEGMVKEKDQIFLAFFLSVVLFQVASLACCFVVMNHNAAWTSAAIFLAGLWYWYKYCLRIYNRFKVSPDLMSLGSHLALVGRYWIFLE
jgi:hypothetical protein